MSETMKQIKFTIESDIVAAFKARCTSEGVSMTSVIRQWMKTRQPANAAQINTLTRQHRRKAVLEIIQQLNVIMDSETDYRDNIPEQFSCRYENAGHSCTQLSEAIDCLEDAF